ncbi:MAG: pilus assembly protein PilM [Planctomycetota bacterium]|nr:pilus assembly protein PilM [Planctomycetota bacterium]
MATGLGIDIGTEFVKVVQARVSGGAVTVTGAVKIPRRTVTLDLPEDGTGNLIVPEGLAHELKRAGLRRTGTVGISGREVILKYLATPPMPPEKLRIYIDMEIGGKLTARGGEATPVTYDYRLLNVPSGLKGDLVIMAGVCKNDYLFGVHSALKSAGLGADSITPSCFGLVNAYLRTQKVPANETVVLVEVGHELLEVAILEENRLYFARSAPGGGKKFTAALDKVLKLGPAKAAEFKHERAKLYPEGTPVASKQELIFQAALREGAENIAGAVRSSIMFCRTQAKLPKLDYHRVILSGGGARLNGLREYLEKKLGRPVVALDLSSGLDMRKLDAESARCFEGEVPDMAVALGLAIIDADPDSLHFTLLPLKIVKQRRFLRKTVFAASAGVVLMAGLVNPIRNSTQVVSAAEERVAFFEQKKAEAKAQKAAFQTQLQQNRVLAQQADYYARMTRMGRVYLQLYSQVRAVMPADIVLTYLGPASDREANVGAGAGVGNWSIDEPVREFMMVGHYEVEAYPGIKFHEAWGKVRAKLLEIPGVRAAELELQADEEKASRPGSKPFQAKIFLQDDSRQPAVTPLAVPKGGKGPATPEKAGPPAKGAGPATPPAKAGR